MKTIRINTPDGKVIKLNAPDDATPEMIQQKAMQAKDMYLSQNPPAAPQKQKGPGFVDTVGEQVKKSLGPIGLAGKAQNVIQEGFNRLGNKVAGSLAQDGVQMAPGTGARPLPVDPRVAAGAGTFTQMVPDMVASVMPGEQAAKAAPGVIKALKAPGKAKVLAKAAEDIGKDISQAELQKLRVPDPKSLYAAETEQLGAAGKSIQDDLSRLQLEEIKLPQEASPFITEKSAVEKTIKGLQSNIDELTTKQAQFPKVQVSKRLEALQAKKEAGKAIQEFEKQHGIGLEGTVEVPKGFINTAKRLAKMDPKDLAETVELSQLQTWQKQADSMLGSADKYDQVLLNKTKAALTDAQDILAPGIKELRNSFKRASEHVQRIPDELKIERANLAEQLKQHKIAYAEAKHTLSDLVAKESEHLNLRKSSIAERAQHKKMALSDVNDRISGLKAKAQKETAALEEALNDRIKRKNISLTEIRTQLDKISAKKARIRKVLMALGAGGIGLKLYK